MKTLVNANDKAEIAQRLRAIGPASQRRWGKMTAPEMICHLSDAFRVAMSEKAALPVSSLFTQSVMKWVALQFPFQWPHGVQTVPECEAGVGGTPPAEIEWDLHELRELLDRFTGQPREFEFAEHAIFGKLSEAEWQRWGYLHMDHHLRQFGA
jgi:hypothetical protein